MPKVFISIGAAFAALVALLMIAPSFVDWTAYRQTFAAAMSVATGQRVEINGEMTFTLLPRPAFNAAGVRVGAGGSSRAMTVERLSARLAFAPLLGGRLQFNSLVLSRPSVEIGRRADGSLDLPLSPVDAAADAAASALFDVQVDRIEIVQGAAVFQGGGGETLWRADGIDLTFAAETAEGPFTLSGGFNASGIPLSAHMTFGRGFADGTRSFSAVVTLDEADASARFNGTLLAAADAVSLRGSLSASGPSAAGVLAAFGWVAAATPVPQAATQPFALDATLRGGADDVELSGLLLDMGGTRAKGTAAWRAARDGAAPRLSLNLELGRADVATWRFAGLTAETRFAALPFVGGALAQDAGRFALPQGFGADIDLRAPALTYRDQTVRDARVVAALDNGELTITEAAASFPAATRGKLSGVVRAVEGEPSIDGLVEFDSQSLRQFLAWIGVNDPKSVPPGRLGSLTLRAALQGTPQRFTLADLNGALDTSRFKGRITLARGARLAVNTELDIDSFNFDAYGGVLGPEGLLAAFAPPPENQTQSGNAYGVAPAFTAFAGLSNFDAELRLQIASVTGGGLAGGRVGADVGLNAGTLRLRTVALEDMAGASAWISGAVSGFGTTPRFENVQFDLRSEDLARLGRALGFTPPPALRGLAPATLAGAVTGGLVQADVTGALQAGGLTVKLKGQVLGLDQTPRFEMDVDGGHANFAELAGLIGLPPSSAAAGAAAVSGRVAGSAAGMKFENVTLRVGDNTASLSGAVNNAPETPVLNADVTNLNVDFDTLWPRDVLQQFSDGLAPDATSRWSDAPLDWSGLGGWTADVRLAGSLLAARGFSAQDFSARLTLADGTLDVSEWNGKILGGAGQLTLQLASDPQPALQVQIAVKDGDLAAFAGLLSRAARPQGTIDVAGAFNAEGGSSRAMVSSLAGRGSISANAASLGDNPLPGLLAPLSAAQQAETLAQGENRPAAMTARAQLAAEAGRIQLEQATVESLSYTGSFTGYIDLPLWQVDLAGSLKAQPGAALGFGQGQLLLPPELPVKVQGPLDLPNVTLMATDN